MAPHFEDAYRFINENLENGKNILVHCAAGISRVILLLTKVNNMRSGVPNEEKRFYF